MRAMMEDLLSGWTVENEWRDLLDLHSRPHFHSDSHSNFHSHYSCNSNSHQDIHSNPRRYGWSPPSPPPSQSNNGRVDRRLVLLRLSPYFAPVLPTRCSTATGKSQQKQRHPQNHYQHYNNNDNNNNVSSSSNNDNGNSNSHHHNHHRNHSRSNGNKPPHPPRPETERARRSRLPQESDRICSAAGRPPLCIQSAEGESVSTLGTTRQPHQPTLSRVSSSAGREFFNSLARVSPPCSGKAVLLPEVKRCTSGGNVATTNSSSTPISSIVTHPAYLYQRPDSSFDRDEDEYDVGSGSGISVSPRSEMRQYSSGPCSSSREGFGEEMTMTEANQQTDLLKWETLCGIERNVMERREIAAKKLNDLQAQIKKTSTALDALKSQEWTMRGQLRSFKRLQGYVLREERKCKELERLAQNARERSRHLSPSLEHEDLFEKEPTPPTAFTADTDELVSITRLLDRRSALQRERSALKEAIRTATLENASQLSSASHGGRMRVKSSSSSRERMQEKQHRQLLQRRQLERTIANLREKEKQMQEKKRHAEIRTRTLTKRIESIRASIRERNEQFQKSVVCRSQQKLEPRLYDDRDTAVEEPHNSFFITDVVV
ncbi:hypothetical protein LSM04_007762 [Trypanosoma melophagium]|uniref:uncharacterized protein n=1 Tax=Trypanosoma melophagium TaxID=715481 RepID=UPI00351A484E|nr:hypothetical protein LSM04_007762 [Trypanosoma melophagium]